MDNSAMTVDVIQAGWDAPSRVQAFTTLRSGGVSRSPYDSLNLAAHVEDDPASVAVNRARLRQCWRLPAEPVWLKQIHATNIVQAERYSAERTADGSHTRKPGVVCAILTADCLPLFLCSADGTQVGLFHVGWKGLVKGMVDRAINSFAHCGKIIAWLGPAIGADAFEIGQEVKIALEQSLQPELDCFQPGHQGKWLADLSALVAHELRRRNVACDYDATLCTYTDQARFFSYRRSQRCGRMASLIWIED